MSQINLKELEITKDGQTYVLSSGSDIATTEQYAEGTAVDLVPNVAQVKGDVSAVNTRIDSTNAGLAALTDTVNNDHYTKTEVDAKVASVYKIKGSVADLTALEAIVDPVPGDVYNLLDTGDNYVWVGPIGETEGFWDKLSGTVDLTNYVTTETLNAGLGTKQDTLVPGTAITIDAETNEISAVIPPVTDVLATAEEWTAGTSTTKAPTVAQVTAAVEDVIEFTVEEIPDSGGKQRGIIAL